MFDINGWEFIALALLALFIFGPERLPKVIGDGMRMLRQVRNMARNATSDLSRELGTDISVEDLNPKTFIRKHLLSEDDEAALRRPFDDAARDLKSVANDVNQVAGKTGGSGSGAAVPDQTRRPQTYDSEAT
jgi:sec-independent protein translocase protein TatB